MSQSKAADGVMVPQPLCPDSPGQVEATVNPLTATLSGVTTGTGAKDRFSTGNSTDNDGRNSGGSRSITRLNNPSCPSTTSSGSFSRGYDAENHITSQTFNNFPWGGSTCLYQPQGSQTLSYDWGPNGHPIRFGMSPLVLTSTSNPTTTPPPTSSEAHETLHWDDDQLLFTTNDSGSVNAIFFGSLAAIYTQSGSSLQVRLTDASPFVVEYDVAGTSGWYPQGKMIQPGFANDHPPSSSGLANVNRDGVVTDGYNEFMGGRTLDEYVGTWNSPDSYEGTVEDPMSQRPYMFNNNNPLAYEDPSGFCPTNPSPTELSDDASCTIIKQHVVPFRPYGNIGPERRSEILKTRQGLDQIMMGMAFVMPGGEFGAAAEAGEGAAAMGPKIGACCTWTVSTAKGARVPNLDLKITAQEFMDELQLSGFAKSTAPNGAQILSKGDSTYTVYTRTSTGDIGASFNNGTATLVKFNFIP